MAPKLIDEALLNILPRFSETQGITLHPPQTTCEKWSTILNCSLNKSPRKKRIQVRQQNRLGGGYSILKNLFKSVHHKLQKPI
jgi:DNA gyrase inhibitor GyrI